MDSLNTLMAEIHMPADARENLRDFLYRSKVVFKDHAYHEVFNLLSPGLQATTMGYMHKGWVNKVGLFKTLPEEEKSSFVAQLALALELKAFAIGEFILRKGDLLDALRIVKEGTLHKLIPYSQAANKDDKEECAKKVLCTGSVFGSEIVVRAAGYRSAYYIRAASFAIVSELTRVGLKGILAHPSLKKTAKKLRMVGLKAVIRTDFLTYCNAFKAIWGMQAKYKESQHEYVGKVVKKSGTGELVIPNTDELDKLVKRRASRNNVQAFDSSETTVSAPVLLTEQFKALEARLEHRMQQMESRLMKAILNPKL